MKILTRILSVLIAVIFLASCGDDEVAPDQSLEEASLAFDAQNPPVQIPSGIQTEANSGDPNASQIYSNLTLINSVSTSFSSFFEIPSGANKSNTPIGRSAGRLAAQGDVVVYSYTTQTTDPDTGETVTVTAAYQITDMGSDFLFEYFFQFDGGEYFKFIEARESKDELNNGYLKIFYSAFDEVQATDAALTFEWTENSAGLLNFSYYTTAQSSNARVDITVNPDNSGNLSIYYDGGLYYTATWNGNGTGGTWAYYDSQGTTTDSGTWPN